MEILRAQNINKSYKKPVLDNISFSLAEGECIGVVGRNGCGKSTLLAILAGGIAADGGQLFIRGVDVFRHRKVFAYAVGYVPQSDPLMEELSVRDNLKLWYGIADRDMREDMAPGGMLDSLGLLPLMKQRAGTLSGGSKRRLCIAGALAAQAEILVLDEPSGGLDVVCRREISDYISAFTGRGGAAVIATHHQEELELCSRVFLLDNGRLIEEKQPVRLDDIIDDIVKGTAYAR